MLENSCGTENNNSENLEQEILEIPVSQENFQEIALIRDFVWTFQ